MYARSAVPRRRASIVLLLVIGLFGSSCSTGATDPSPMSTRDFVFVSSGRRLSGLIDQPSSGETRALVVFVHGSGTTNVRDENRYVDLRRRFVELGIASVLWDKPGQGRSEGEFDENQPLESSAQEVLDAIATLRAGNVRGSERIGVWSTSRGSWVAPIAMYGRRVLDVCRGCSGRGQQTLPDGSQSAARGPVRRRKREADARVARRPTDLSGGGVV